MPSFDTITVSNNGRLLVSGTGRFSVYVPTVTMSGMTDSSNNPPANYDGFDGTYYPCTPELCTSNVTGASVTDDGFLYKTLGGSSRYVWQNENGYKLAINSNDSVMNLYDSTTNINTGQAGRLGFTWGYSDIYINASGSNAKANGVSFSRGPNPNTSHSHLFSNAI